MDETPKPDSTNEETPIDPAPPLPPQTTEVIETPPPEPVKEPVVQEQPEEPIAEPTPPPEPEPEPIPEPTPPVEETPPPPPPTPEPTPTPPIVEEPKALPPTPTPDPVPEPPKPVKDEPVLKEPKVEPTPPLAPAVHDPKYIKDVPQRVLELTEEEINAARKLWAREHIGAAQMQANKNRTARMNKRMDEIEKIVKAKPNISVHTIANSVQLSQKLTSGYLQKLVHVGRIKAAGNTNSRLFY